MAYRCPKAIIGGATEAIRCKVSGDVCAHQKMCMMKGRIVLTDKAMFCPGREMEDKAETVPKKPKARKTATAKPAAKKTAKKT